MRRTYTEQIILSHVAHFLRNVYGLNLNLQTHQKSQFFEIITHKNNTENTE